MALFKSCVPLDTLQRSFRNLFCVSRNGDFLPCYRAIIDIVPFTMFQKYDVIFVE